jgi:hypothetical protein
MMGQIATEIGFPRAAERATHLMLSLAEPGPVPSRMQAMFIAAALLATGVTFMLGTVATSTMFAYLDAHPHAATILRNASILGVILPLCVVHLRKIRGPGA